MFNSILQINGRTTFNKLVNVDHTIIAKKQIEGSQ
jgi:hypothetical protein